MNAQLLAAINARRKNLGEQQPQIKPPPKSQFVAPTGQNKQNFNEARKLLEANLFKPNKVQESPNQKPKQQIKGNHENMMNAKKLLEEKFGAKKSSGSSNQSIGLPNLPPPPPPPSLNIGNLPPPPPPPPSLNLMNLPPPPSLDLKNLLPPPPPMNINNLPPPPPSFNTNSQNPPVQKKTEQIIQNPPVKSKIEPVYNPPPPPYQQKSSNINPSNYQNKNRETNSFKSKNQFVSQVPSESSKIKTKQSEIRQQRMVQKSPTNIKGRSIFNQQVPKSKAINQNFNDIKPPVQNNQIPTQNIQPVQSKTQPTKTQQPLQPVLTEKSSSNRNSKRKHKLFKQEPSITMQFFGKDLAGFIKRQFIKNSDIFKYIGQGTTKTNKSNKFYFPSIEKGTRGDPNMSGKQTLYVDTRDLNLAGTFMVNNLNGIKDHKNCRENFLAKLKNYDINKDPEKLNLKAIKQVAQSVPNINYSQPNLVKISHALTKCDALMNQKSALQQFQQCTKLKKAKQQLVSLVQKYCKYPEDCTQEYEKIERNIERIKQFETVSM